MAGDVWFLPHPRNEGSLVYGAHKSEQCQIRRSKGEGCALHGPTAHWAVGLPLVFVPPLSDPYRPGGMFRECIHDVHHDDPDDIAFRKSIKDKSRKWKPARTQPCKCDCCSVAGSPCEWEAPF